jgi:hypothetical protein
VGIQADGGGGGGGASAGHGCGLRWVVCESEGTVYAWMVGWVTVGGSTLMGLPSSKSITHRSLLIEKRGAFARASVSPAVPDTIFPIPCKIAGTNFSLALIVFNTLRLSQSPERCSDSQVTCTPCRHWSARTAWDRFKTLWCRCVRGGRSLV